MSITNARSDLELVGRSLELSAHVIAEAPGQLAGQLVGRLFGSDRPAIRGLLDGIRRTRSSTWLCPASAGLRAPGGPLVRSLDSPADLLAIAPGGDVVSGGADGMARVWDMGSAADPTLLGRSPLDLRRTTGTRLGDDGRTPVLITEPADATAIEVLPDSGEIAIGYGDDHDTIALLDVIVGTLTRTLVGHPADGASGICDLVMTPGGERLLALSRDGTLRAWPLSMPGPARTVAQIQRAKRMAISPDARWVVVALGERNSASQAGEEDRGPGTPVIDLHTGTTISQGPGLEQRAWGGEATAAPSMVVVGRDGRHVLSGFGDDHDTVLMWDVASGSPLRRFVGHPADRGALESRGVNSLATTPDGASVITGHNDGRLLVWSIDRADEPAELPGHAGPVHDIVVTTDGSRIVSCGNDGIKLWDLDAASAIEPAPTALRNTKAMFGAAVSADGGRAAVCFGHGEVVRWSIETGWSTFANERLERLAPTGTALTPDGSRLAVSGFGGLLVWDTERNEEPVTIAAPHPLQTVLLTDDGRWAATRGRGGTNGFDPWDLHRGVVTRQVPLDGDTWGIAGLAEDGRVVVAADWQTGEVAEFDLHRRKLRVRRFETKLRTYPRISRMSASVEAGRVLVISTDQRLSTWDLRSGLKTLDLGTRGRAVPGETTDRYSPEARVDPTQPWVTSVAMTRNGRWAATGTSNGWVELVDLDHGEVLADFRLDAPVLAVAVDDDGGAVAALDESGAVIRLQKRLG